MAPQDSDSSDEDTESFTTTDVLLGYASKEPTGDIISQLGGRPIWLDPSQPPSAALARCKICNDYMPLLLQLHGDLPEYFPGHERRLHMFGCKRRTCRRKEGSMRAIRSVRVTDTARSAKNKRAQKTSVHSQTPVAAPLQNLGSSIFGIAPPSAVSGQTNPFSSPTMSQNNNPFSSNPVSTSSGSSSNPSASINPVASDISKLPDNFAEKVRFSSPPITASTPKPPPEPWPSDISLAQPYPSYHLDADYETLDQVSEQPIPSATMMDLDEPNGASSNSAKEDTDTFESTIDKTFQRFADRLAQNPLQVLRYEFRGFPLLYSKTDPVGILVAPHQHHFAGHDNTGGNNKIATAHRTGSAAIGLPPCQNCGAGRVFEMQLTPQAIMELEVNEVGLEGMEWGNVILGVCSADCGGGEAGAVGYVEEWVGVQWEERDRP
ncbi:hypothetical protein MMC26_005109 [Xylographa opegraphella]|nr:hypothetical protein [Xylographa opegraphella]